MASLVVHFPSAALVALPAASDAADDVILGRSQNAAAGTLRLSYKLNMCQASRNHSCVATLFQLPVVPRSNFKCPRVRTGF